MKVLVSKAAALRGPTATDALTFTYGGGDFELLTSGEKFTGKGVIAEMPKNAVKAIIIGRCAGSYLEPKDLQRDVDFIAKFCVDYEDGTEVECKVKSNAFYLVGDPTGKIDRAPELAEGDVVAVGPNISPKALMNLHGLVVSVKGAKAVIEPEKGDLDRLCRATGKTWGKTIKMPTSSLEKVA